MRRLLLKPVLLIPLILALVFPSWLQASTIYVQSFDGLSVGNLGGQDSWTATVGNWTVQTSTVAVGSKAISTATDNAKIERDIASSSVGIYQAYVRKESISANPVQIYLYKNGFGSYALAKLIGDGTSKLQIYNHPSWLDTGSSFAVNTWHLLTMEWDIPNNRYRAKLDGAAFSSWATMNSQNIVDHIIIETGTGGTAAQVDELQITTDGTLSPVVSSRKLRGSGISR